MEVLHGPRACILKADGGNCDQETAYALELAGARSKIVPINDFLERRESLLNYQIVVTPGGFAHGDHVRAGVILAVELMTQLGPDILELVDRGKTLVAGICNGFQVLVETHLLPFGHLDRRRVALRNNTVGHFVCDWVNLQTEKTSRCVFLDEVPEQMRLMVAHGEGRFATSRRTLREIEAHKLVVFRYVDRLGKPTQAFPDNPNGSLNAIAGICDPTGRILGMMPHPERPKHLVPQGLALFQGMVRYASQS